MRLPRLPVSRRRHDELAELVCAYNRIASEDLAEYKRRARKAEARVAELEQDRDDLVGRIKALYDARQRGSQTVATEHAERNLYAVLDCHDRQEREHEPLEPPTVSDELRQQYRGWQERSDLWGGRR